MAGETTYVGIALLSLASRRVSAGRQGRAIGKRNMQLIKGMLIAAVLIYTASAGWALTDQQVRDAVVDEIDEALPDEGPGGAAVVIRIGGRTLFFNYGTANSAGKPITSDSLFNLASLGKTFDTTLLSLAVLQGEVSLDDPVAKYVTELQQGGDIRKVTLGQLVTYTSGLTLPQDRPPWPKAHYTLPTFLSYLNNWKMSPDHQPGKTVTISHAPFMLLHVALERRFGMPYQQLLEQRLLRPLGLSSTILPLHRNSVAQLPPSLMRRAVQNYDDLGEPVGKPGDVQGFYHWPGTGQMFSSARDMATFLAVQLGEGPEQPLLREAVALAQRPIAAYPPYFTQALAWEVRQSAATIVDKNGALNNTSSYFGLIPDKRIGMVLLTNRGEQYVAKVGRRTLLRLGLPEDIALKELQELEEKDE
jgi:beta-lactamase class C